MTIRAKNPVVASDYRFKGSNERAIGFNGEVNASSKRDLLIQNHRLMQATASGDVITEKDATERAAIRQTNKELLQAAFDNKEAHRVLGERMAEEIYMTANRKGFARRFMNRMDLKQGEIPRFPVRKKNATAMWVSGPTRVETEVLTDKWYTPPELQIVARVFVPQNEINQSSSDVLEEKYVEALEGVMVTEDRLWYNMAKQTVGIDNNQTIVAGTLSSLAFMSVRQQVSRWGLKSVYCLLASDLFQDIVGSTDFQNAIEPVARHELVMTGELAILYGMTLISESYRHPEHKVLSQGEFLVVSDPLMHGAFSDRGGVDSAPIDGVSEKIIGRGWLISESMAMSIANTRSVAYAVRS